MLEVRLDGVELKDHPDTFDQGFVIEPGGLSGWFESAEGRISGGDRPAAHGAFDVPVLRSARTIQVTGHILARTQTELESMQDQLTGLLVDGGSDDLEVQTDSGTKSARVRVISAKAPELDERTASFILQMIAADPRRYGETRVQGPAVSVNPTHKGHAIAASLIRVTGNMPSGYRINGPGGRQYVVTQALAPGQTHEIDMTTGWLFRNGIWQRTAVSRAETWGVPPGIGSTPMEIVPVSGSGLMTTFTKDTDM